MIQIEEINCYLEKALSDKRYRHSVSTAETARELARIYGGHAERAYLAGLVHDCARENGLASQQSMVKALGIEVDSATYQNSGLLHAYSAEYVIRQQFKIEDEDIIAAVRSHTTGKEDMTLLEKIIFLSDILEPYRSFPGVEDIRVLSKHSLDEALIAAFDASIRFLIEKKALIHQNTIHARNFLLRSLQK